MYDYEGFDTMLITIKHDNNTIDTNAHAYNIMCTFDSMFLRPLCFAPSNNLATGSTYHYVAHHGIVGNNLYLPVTVRQMHQCSSSFPLEK